MVCSVRVECVSVSSFGEGLAVWVLLSRADRDHRAERTVVWLSRTCRSNNVVGATSGYSDTRTMKIDREVLRRHSTGSSLRGAQPSPMPKRGKACGAACAACDARGQCAWSGVAGRKLTNPFDLLITLPMNIVNNSNNNRL